MTIFYCADYGIYIFNQIGVNQFLVVPQMVNGGHKSSDWHLPQSFLALHKRKQFGIEMGYQYIDIFLWVDVSMRSKSSSAPN